MGCSETVQLKKIVSIQTGYPFRGKFERDPTGNVAVVQMKDIDDYSCIEFEDLYRVQVEDLSRKHLLQTHDILFRSRGVTNTAALVPDILGKMIAAAPLTVIRVKSVKVEPAYLVWYLNHPQGQARLSSLAQGTSLAMVNKADLAELTVELPALDIQKGIAALAALGQQEQRLLEELRQKRKVYMDGLLMQRVKAKF
jgi:restriction endonuclease S subunit